MEPTTEQRLDLAIWALGEGSHHLGSSSTALILWLVSGKPRGERTGDWPLDWGDAQGHVKNYARLPDWARPIAKPKVIEAVDRVHAWRADDALRDRLLAKIEAAA